MSRSRLEYSTFQFTPLREGRQNLQKLASNKPISIHAPPRGATFGVPHCNRSAVISIHAPPRGATGKGVGVHGFFLLFQFTPLREGRQLGGVNRSQIVRISIHAPPRGATVGGVCCLRLALISIHAPPRGATAWRVDEGNASWNFNSRPSARGDRGHSPNERHHRNFNSRPSARGDAQTVANGNNVLLFQFTPLREGRREGNRRGKQSADFNSRPSARGDRHSKHHSERCSHFNSRPSARGDDVTSGDMPGSVVFQFTPLREGRRKPSLMATTSFYFNSRPSARGDAQLRRKEQINELISIHAPPRGATAQAADCCCKTQFQFTPLREGRPTRIP